MKTGKIYIIIFSYYRPDLSLNTSNQTPEITLSLDIPLETNEAETDMSDQASEPVTLRRREPNSYSSAINRFHNY